jgi:hypothetical protein
VRAPGIIPVTVTTNDFTKKKRRKRKFLSRSSLSLFLLPDERWMIRRKELMRRKLKQSKMWRCS